MAKSKAQKKSAPKLRFTVNNALTTIYVILMFTLFPLYLSNHYGAARRDKFWLFFILTLIVGVSVGAVALATFISRNSEYNKKLNTYTDPFKLNFTDIAFLAFVGLATISTIFSPHFSHALWGLSSGNSGGRNMGLITLALLLVSYFVISRYFFFKKYIFYCIFGGITLVTFFAIVNYYYIDPIGHFNENLYAASDYQNVVKNFTSSIGNKNYLSALICVALPFSVGVAISSQDKVMRTVAYISTAIQFMGLLVATSDGGFLGCFLAFGIMTIVIIRDLNKLSRFTFCLFIMSVASKLMWIFDLIMKGNSKGYTSLSEFFIFSPSVFGAIIVLAGITVMLSLLAKKRNGKQLPRAATFISTGILAAVVLGFAALMIYFSCINTTAKLEGFTKFFRYNDSWGTHRGYFWNRSFAVFKDFNFIEKLIGTGPETFYFAFEGYFDEMKTLFGETSTNAAHNVYLNYLITNGILGAVSYLALVGSSIFFTLKRSAKNPLALTCLGVIVAFAAQDIVNIANPVNTPWFIIFIAISEATRLRANSTETLKSSGY